MQGPRASKTTDPGPGAQELGVPYGSEPPAGAAPPASQETGRMVKQELPRPVQWGTRGEAARREAASY